MEWVETAYSPYQRIDVVVNCLGVLQVGPGSDTNAGMSPDAPIRHIQSALDRASYGDTVLIMPGVYREQIGLDRRFWPADRGAGSPASATAL